MRLLVVEDDDVLRAAIIRRFTHEGYAVDGCADGRDGLYTARSAPYDAVILDVMLPGLDGFQILSALRSDGFPGGVLLLTARDTVSDRVTGLDLGADDYLTKPFAFDELLARVRALLRKHTPSRSPVLACGGLTMDTTARRVMRGSRAIALTAKEYALLEYMLRNPHQVLTRGQIFDHVWNYDSTLGVNLVDVYIGYLRSKIDKGEPVRLIRTVRGFGYMLSEEETP